MKPLVIDHPFVAQLFTFLQTQGSFLATMLCFVGPKPKTDDHQKISAMVQHLKATGARRETAQWAPY